MEKNRRVMWRVFRGKQVLLAGILLSLFAGLVYGEDKKAADPTIGHDWALGPFTKLKQPILSPTADSTFDCPMTGQVVKWEEWNVYNPAAVVRNGKVHLLYRADDKIKKKHWNRTCRIGLAVSEDGRKLTRSPKPVLYPDNDACKEHEWVGGPEDIHIVEDEKGVYYAYYTAYTGKKGTMLVATSKDLKKWTKHGQAFVPKVAARTGVVVSRLVGEKLVATKINGKYWMYFGYRGTGAHVAQSDDLIKWTLYLNKKGKPARAIPPRRGKLDGGGGEAGAIALLTEKGIIFFYNGVNHDKRYPKNWAVLGQALMDKNDPAKLLDRLDEPLLYAESEWEMKGFYSPALVANGLVFFKGEWLLYYGGADRWIGLATYKPEKE